MGIIGDFRPIIWELKAEGLVPSSKPVVPHIMYVDAPESSEMRIVVTDFKFSTWMAVKSVIQLENMVSFFSFFLTYCFGCRTRRNRKVLCVL